MYVHFSLARVLSFPTTKHSNNHAMKMHSALQSQDKSKESPLGQHVSVDDILILESTVHFYNYPLHTYHMWRSSPSLPFIQSPSTPAYCQTPIYRHASLTRRHLRLSASSPACVVLTSLPLSNTIARCFPSKHALSPLSLNHLELLPSTALLFTRLLFN